MFLLFPHGRLLSARWRIAALLAIAAGGTAALSAILSTTEQLGRLSFDKDVLGAEGFHLAGVLVASETLLGALVVAAAFSVALRQRRSVGRSGSSSSGSHTRWELSWRQALSVLVLPEGTPP